MMYMNAAGEASHVPWYTKQSCRNVFPGIIQLPLVMPIARLTAGQDNKERSMHRACLLVVELSGLRC
jgi:hypothetical protein